MDSQRSAAIEDEYNRCRREFDKIDVNKDGKVTVEELHLMMTSKGYSYSVEDIKQIISAVDGNNDGKIVFNEFLSLMKKIRSEQVCEKEKSERDAELNKAFRVFDTDGDGFISLEEFTSALKHLKLETEANQIGNLFRKLDGNGDGKVDFNEFVRLFLG